MRKTYIFLFFLYNLVFVNAWGIGVSPDKLAFNEAEKNIFVFNPNNFDVNYYIEGCDYDFLEFLRTGKVIENSKRSLLIRYNPKLNTDVNNCSLDILFSNNFYSTGFSVELYFDQIPDQTDDIGLSSLFSGATTTEEKKSDSNIIFIAVASLVFLIMMVVIIKFF